MCRHAYNKTSQLIGKPIVATSIISSLVYNPIVIAIVTYNKIELLKKCLASIIEKTKHPDYLIAILSNGCNDGTIEYLNQLQNEYPDLIRIFKNNENEFFVRPNNHIMNAFPDRDVVLINNDIEIVNDNWLNYLYHAAYSSPQIGAAGGLLLSPDGLVSEAGAMVHTNGYCENIGRGLSPNLTHLQTPRIVDYCSGCFLYLRRDAIREIGIFDDRFHPMYYEDVDWQMRLQQIGRATLYTPLAQAVHFEGSSAGTEAARGMKRFQEINRIKFVEKFSK
jgi:GT2 family glycosyltransferase